MPVHVISVKGRGAEMCDRWFDAWLLPRLQEHKRLAQESLRRKISLLREATLAALQRRLDRRSSITKDLADKWSAAEAGLGAGLAGLESAARERPERPGLAQRILADAARQIADEWRRRGDVELNGAAVAASKGNDAVSAVAAAVAQSLTLLREDLVGVLRAASIVAGDHEDDSAEIPPPTGMPTMDFASTLSEMPLRRPLLNLPLERLAVRKIRTQLDRGLGDRLEAAVDRHLKQLSDWRSHVLAQMRQAFTAKGDFYSAQCQQSLPSVDSAAVERDIKRLESLERDAQAEVRPQKPQRV